MNEGSSTWLFLIGMNLWYFMSGAEYGLILPTQNEYMLTLGAAPKVIGIAFTLFAFAGLVSSPFCGWATDRLGAIKLPLLTMITCSIVGSVIYTFTRSIPGIFLGRLVQGVGWGIDGAIIGRVALITEKCMQEIDSHRSGVIQSHTHTVAHHLFSWQRVDDDWTVSANEAGGNHSWIANRQQLCRFLEFHVSRHVRNRQAQRSRPRCRLYVVIRAR
jgi:hypothetical protein